MKLHNVGAKADRDRAVVLNSYQEMCRIFRVPRGRRLTTQQIALMTNTQLYQASKDLYNAQPIKKARKLAVRLGVMEAPQRRPSRLYMIWARIALRLSTLFAKKDRAHA